MCSVRYRFSTNPSGWVELKPEQPGIITDDRGGDNVKHTVYRSPAVCDISRAASRSFARLDCQAAVSPINHAVLTPVAGRHHEQAGRLCVGSVDVLDVARRRTRAVADERLRRFGGTVSLCVAGSIRLSMNTLRVQRETSINRNAGWRRANRLAIRRQALTVARSSPIARA